MIAEAELTEMTETEPADPLELDEGELDPRPGRGSKWNSLQHGLMAQELFPPKLKAQVKRFTTLVTEYSRPTSSHEVQLMTVMGRSGAQMNHCEPEVHESASDDGPRGLRVG